MWRSLSPLLSLTLALALVVAGQAIALSKAANPATGEMTLCTAAGVVTVFTDADGNPTAAPHLCPDCALTLLAGLGPATGGISPVDVATRAASPMGAHLAWQPALQVPNQPRGPPFTV